LPSGDTIEEEKYMNYVTMREMSNSSRCSATILALHEEVQEKRSGIAAPMSKILRPTNKSLILLVVTSILLFVLLSLSPAFASTEKVLWSFGGNGDGAGPQGNLIVDASGNFYGTTGGGGTNSTGTVFELSPDGKGGWTESVLYSFGPQGGGDGQQPDAGLVMDGSGNLYGTTFVGGTKNAGIVFQLSPKAGGGWTETVIHNFGNRGDGSLPTANLVLDAHGNLYGTTGSGGTKSGGTVFQLIPRSKGWTETLLYNFPTDFQPATGLMWRRVGLNLYGVTKSGGEGLGNVFRLWHHPTGWVEKNLHSFDNVHGNPQYPGGDLVEDQNLTIYGGSNGGCANGTGGVWALFHNPGKPSTYQLLYSFGAEGSGDGNYPQSGVIVGSNGTLYGTTGFGGVTFLGGTVFALTQSGNTWQETILYKFTGGNDGGAPTGQLIQDSQGNLYGTAGEGGAFGGGVVFEVTP
jgi:uncharacterized repeat protein (TIGR03803 family)